MKYEFIDEADAPENLSGMSIDARAKLELLRALKPGKVAKVPVEKAATRGFKAALTRLAKGQQITIEVWDHEGYVYVRLAGN
jgi:hypothetical protein